MARVRPYIDPIVPYEHRGKLIRLLGDSPEGIEALFSALQVETDEALRKITLLALFRATGTARIADLRNALGPRAVMLASDAQLEDWLQWRVPY